MLWVTLIVLGTFLRGPNWNFFGPFEHWNPYKNVPLGNVNLSEMFWRNLLGVAVGPLPGTSANCPASCSFSATCS